MTGYWASGRARTKVHLVHEGAKRPWCGALVDRRAQFYWVTTGFETLTVECKACLAIKARAHQQMRQERR